MHGIWYIKTTFNLIKELKNWHMYFLDYFGLINKKFVLEARNGAKYILRPNSADRGIINEICANHIYTPKGFEIKEKDVVLDIGAQVGIFSIYASKYAKKGKVYAFEPVKDNFTQLKENIALNKNKNIIPLNLAVSSKNEKKTIFLSDDNTGGHSLYKELVNSSKKIIVEAISLNYFFNKYNLRKVDFLKLDCEGAEYDILFNVTKANLRKVRQISLEYHNIDKNKNVEKMKEFLEENGFKIRIDNKDKHMLYASH